MEMFSKVNLNCDFIPIVFGVKHMAAFLAVFWIKLTGQKKTKLKFNFESSANGELNVCVFQGRLIESERFIIMALVRLFIWN